MIDLAQLTQEDFESHLETTFVVQAPAGGSVELRLTRVTATQTRRPSSSGEGRQGFALLFRGPAEPALEQGTFAVTQGGPGQMALFMVPVGQDDQGRLYESVFS